MTDEQFKQLMDRLDFIALQISKGVLAVGILMNDRQKTIYARATSDLIKEWKL